MKKYIMLGIAALAFGVGFGANQTKVNAATWHSSAVPSRIRGTWHAKQNHSYTFKITSHTFKYSGESKISHLRWSYRGHGFYRLKGGHDGESILVHYFNHHRLSSNSFWHDYIK